MLVHHIYNAAVLKMGPKLHTPQSWPLSVEVSSHVLTSSPPVPPPTPLSHLHNSRTTSAHMESSSTFCPMKECCIQHGFVVLLRAVDIYSDIAFLDCIVREGELSHRHIIQERLFFIDKRAGEYLDYASKYIANPGFKSRTVD